MSTFKILMLAATVAALVAACDTDSTGPAVSADAAQTEVGPPSAQPNPMAVEIGPSGLRAR